MKGRIRKGKVMPDVIHPIKIQVSPERVYQALTTAGGVRDC